MMNELYKDVLIVNKTVNHTVQLTDPVNVGPITTSVCTYNIK